MEYKKFDVVYTIQWPFDHFELDENKYITETEAKEKYEKKEYFEVVYFKEGKRVFCIDFEINRVVVDFYKDGGPYYEYVYDLVQDNYSILTLHSVRERHIYYNFNKNGFVYITENTGLLGKDKRYRKAYDMKIKKEIKIAFKEYDGIIMALRELQNNLLFQYLKDYSI